MGMILFLYFLALVACASHAAPALSPLNSTTNATATSLSSLFMTQHLSVLVTHPPSNASILFSSLSSHPVQSNTISRVASSTPLSFNSSFLSSSLASSTPAPSTILVTKVATVFETTTVNATPSPTATVIATPSPSTWDDRTQWAAPPQMTDLSAFNITDFPTGERNLDIVAQIPAAAIAPDARHFPSVSNANASSNTNASASSNTTSMILQLVYPAHSVNPGSEPKGGADFYATPLNLAGARNVTLEYRVFFPADFNWVKGGKLPGLFGGHTGCSGGSSADDCFSTRMMWRPQGAGELYLYAPKDKQTDALCADPESVCDSAYGFSIGRGSFNFTAGDWTHLQQNVVLNTPGKNDGVFVLFVDGRQTINRTDIFYRDDVDGGSSSDDADAQEGAAEFIGLFFSTFFGGHGKKYATPKQQYTWFKDFAIVRYD